MSEIKPNVTLDVRGLFCPQPVIKCAEEIKKQPTGTILEVLATDSARCLQNLNFIYSNSSDSGNDWNNNRHCFRCVIDYKEIKREVISLTCS